jgi:hypothetical protein
MTDKVSKAQEKLVTNYKNLFNCPNGQIVLYDLETRFGMFKTSFVAKDAYGTAFNEGQRSVMLFILDMMNKNMKQFNEQVQEQKDFYSNEFEL